MHGRAGDVRLVASYVVYPLIVPPKLKTKPWTAAATTAAHATTVAGTVGTLLLISQKISRAV